MYAEFFQYHSEDWIRIIFPLSNYSLSVIFQDTEAITKKTDIDSLIPRSSLSAPLDTYLVSTMILLDLLLFYCRLFIHNCL